MLSEADILTRRALEAKLAERDATIKLQGERLAEAQKQLADVRGLHAAALDHVVDADRQADEAKTENARLRERVVALEAKCDLLSASLAKQDAQVAALTKRCEAALATLDEARAATFNDLGQAESYEAGAVHAAIAVLRGAALESNDDEEKTT